MEQQRRKALRKAVSLVFLTGMVGLVLYWVMAIVTMDVDIDKPEALEDDDTYSPTDEDYDYLDDDDFEEEDDDEDLLEEQIFDEIWEW